MAVDAPPPPGPQDLLKAGLKAIGQAQGQALARHSRIFELLLGMGAAPTRPLRPLEELFDTRVARALERLRPHQQTEELASLKRRLEVLEGRVRRLEAAARHDQKPHRHA